MSEGGKALSSIRRRLALASPVALITVLALLSMGAAPVQASGGTTVHEQFPLSNYVLTNLCNAQVVSMQGEMYITTTTTPTSDGGFTVRAVSSAPNLTGATVPPQQYVAYSGQDVESSHSYYAPPPNPASTIYDAHWTKLVPHANMPSMYLVVVYRIVVTSDGTALPTVNGVYLVCRPSDYQKVPHCSGGSDH
jgi:hypothetical protein